MDIVSATLVIVLSTGMLTITDNPATVRDGKAVTPSTGAYWQPKDKTTPLDKGIYEKAITALQGVE